MAGKKKDFTQSNTGRVYSTIAEATAEPETQEVIKTRKERKTYNEQEAHDFLEAGRTQGRKGLKMVRINMAFDESTHEYIRTMSKYLGMSITEFTAMVFKQNMQLNAEKYEQIKKERNTIIL